MTFQNELKQRGIDNRFIHISGETRTNTKVVDTSNNIYTDINEAGPAISEDNLNKFLQEFNTMCRKDDIVVLSGGAAPSIPKDIYEIMTEKAKDKGAFVILDADDELLREGIKGKPDIIKPNVHEFCTLYNINEKNERDIINSAKKLLADGVKKVLISLGEKGSLFITSEGVYYAEGLNVPVKSTVGAGDSMVAALVYSKLNNLDDVETLKFAAACGTASVTLDGTEACTLKQANEFLKDIKVIIKEEF